MHRLEEDEAVHTLFGPLQQRRTWSGTEYCRIHELQLVGVFKAMRGWRASSRRAPVASIQRVRSAARCLGPTWNRAGAMTP